MSSESTLGDDEVPAYKTAAQEIRTTMHHVKRASFFLAGQGLCLPVRIVKKVDRFARRVLAEPRRRLCP